MHGNVDGIHAHTDSYTHAKSHTLTYTHTHTQSFCSRTGQSPKSICLWYTLVLKLVALSTKKLKQLTGRPTMYIIDRWATTRITAQAVQS